MSIQAGRILACPYTRTCAADDRGFEETEPRLTGLLSGLSTAICKVPPLAAALLQAGALGAAARLARRAKEGCLRAYGAPPQGDMAVDSPGAAHMLLALLLKHPGAGQARRQLMQHAA